jgi:soluble lytic murein transglycosylase-like protein/tetratricopeptide (TPR) repeat protein
MNARSKAAFVALLTMIAALVALPVRTAHTEQQRGRLSWGALPVRTAHTELLGQRLQAPGVLSAASQTTHRAIERAGADAIAQHERPALRAARDLIEQGRHAQARRLLLALIARLEAQGEQAPAGLAPRAQILLARAQLGLERPSAAVEALQDWLGKTPIDDHVRMLYAQALSAAGRHRLAADAYAVVVARPDSPMVHRARAQRAHALYAAGAWAEAERALTEVIDLYPDYPRRPHALFELARAKEAQDKREEAAQLYDLVAFDYPFREQGRDAAVRLAALQQAHKITLPARSFEERFARARQLRIDKHWPIARARFLELEREAIERFGPDSEQVHEIWVQLGMNADVFKDYHEALGYFTRLRADWEAGKRAGIPQALVYQFQADNLARTGKLKEAIAALEKLHEKPRSAAQIAARADAIATFWAEYGRYGEARKVLAAALPPAKQLTDWRFTWLLYKTGDLDMAFDQFMAMAARGRSGDAVAKPLYWAARARERQGKDAEARAIFTQLTQEHASSYYGIQANNRLIDMEERKRSGEPVLVRQARELDAASALAMFEPVQGSLTPIGPGLWQAPWDARTQQRGVQLSFAMSVTPAAEVASAPAVATKALPDTPLTPAGELAQRSWTARMGAAGLPTLPPERIYTSRDNQKMRVPPRGQARIYWDKDRDAAAASFARYDAGEAIGPIPEAGRAYGSDTPTGALDAAIAQIGPLFPELERARWLDDVGLIKEARWAMRDVAREWQHLLKAKRPKSEPVQIEERRMHALIDNRRRPSATWGYTEKDYRWPVPTEAAAKQAMLVRQQTIIDRKAEIGPLLFEALREVGDFYMVRRLTLERQPGARGQHTSHPRAFPEKVVPESIRRGINPYFVWAIMTVESSYNPDSISHAEALGLLQVIPRTGLKVAELLGDEDFGHYDLLDEDVAIRHGVFYLAELVRKFHGQELLAMAGYNGGPHRVSEWLDMRGDQPLDEFIEEIPYDQAREYAKKVTRFVGLYLRAYEGRNTLYIGQQLRRDYKIMPNF